MDLYEFAHARTYRMLRFAHIKLMDYEQRLVISGITPGNIFMSMGFRWVDAGKTTTIRDEINRGRIKQLPVFPNQFGLADQSTNSLDKKTSRF